MTTSLALLLATAAITACGGGGVDTATTSSPLNDSTTPAVSEAGTSSTASSASTETATTNDTAAALLTSDSPTETTESASTSTAAAVSTTSSTNTSTTTTSTTASIAAAPATPVIPTTSAVATVATTPAVAATATTTNSSSTASNVVARPSYNTGTGFYVVGKKLYDTSGQEFRIRGVNRIHWDQSASATGIPLTGANTERIGLNFTRAAALNVSLVKDQIIAKGLVAMPGNWGGTCKTDLASLQAVVDTWVAQAPAWTALDRYTIINIANEWGPANSTVWRDGYITAIARMRAAGYTGTLSITSGGCGQDQYDLENYAQAVFDSDPQKNVIFDMHVYGAYHDVATASWQHTLPPAAKLLGQLNVPVIFGEFGPGKNIGPSPTMITPQTVVSTAEAYGFGWLVWAWDDSDLNACAADDNWFAMAKKCGAYTTTNDLTAFGQLMVPIIQSLAKPAQNFKL